MHDELVHVLQRPAARREFAGEPVEQLGMRRLVAAEAEVAGRGDEALAEVMMPEAIH